MVPTRTDEPDAAPEEVGAGEGGASFEASAERLAAIVERLESGELSLEKSLELFEEGVQVARAAQARLESAEKRVEELIGIDERGEPRARPLGP